MHSDVRNVLLAGTEVGTEEVRRSVRPNWIC